MAKHTKEEFSALTGVATKNLYVYLKRNQLVMDGEFFDDKVEPNKTFLTKRRVKNGGKTLTEVAQEPVEKKAKPQTETELTVDEEGSLYIKDLKQKIVKREEEIIKLKLDNEQKMGKVIPTETAKNIFTQHSQSITTEFKNFAEDLVRTMAKRAGMTIEDTAYIKGQLIAGINDALTKAVAASERALINISG